MHNLFNMRYGKGSLLVAVMFLLLLPALQTKLHLVSERDLVGFFKPALPEPDLTFFTWPHWFSGEFQQQITVKLEDHIGFRKTLFRIQNEYDYRLFRIIHAQGFVQGKQGYLFEEDYIHEFLGRYFIGPEILDSKLLKLAQLSRDLSKSGIPFVLVFEPGKASFYPEYIPDRYHPELRTESNYDYVLHKSEDLEISVVNLNRYFLQMKDTARYPLFPKYGMHWSIYGSVVAMDTLFRYVEAVTGTDLPAITISDPEVSDSMRWTDKDIGELLNLILPLPGERLAYPLLNFDTTVPKKLSILVIADSYYINIIRNSSGQLFKNHEYWYYNSKLYPHIIDDQNPVYIDKTNLKEKLLSFDVVLLMVSEINMHCGFWNFAEEAYLAFHPDHQDPPWYPSQNTILNNREWFNYIVSKARSNHISTGDAIIRDAKFIYNTKNP